VFGFAIRAIGRRASDRMRSWLGRPTRCPLRAPHPGVPRRTLSRTRPPRFVIKLGGATMSNRAAHGALTVRVGMLSAVAIEQSGDWYGATVSPFFPRRPFPSVREALLIEAIYSGRRGNFERVDAERNGSHQLKNISEALTITRQEPAMRTARIDWPIGQHAEWPSSGAPHPCARHTDHECPLLLDEATPLFSRCRALPVTDGSVIADRAARSLMRPLP
jgi:hypothetical protein